MASGEFVKRHNLKPLAKIVGAATAGVLPRIMGIGPAPHTKLMQRIGWSIDDLDVVELNEAFAAQGPGGVARTRNQ